VDEIAQLLEQAVYKPVIGRFKVFMIDEVHMLTNTAFNAMLKTLEEPPAYLKFVLATTDPQKVPATVLSRCLQFNLRPMAPETILEHLVQVLAAESVPAEPQALRLLARAARGSMRDALSLTDQAIAFGSGSLAEAGVRLMLGSVDRSYVYQLLDALARGDGKSIIELCEVLRLNGFSAASTLEEMTSVLQRMAVLQAVPEAGAADDASDPDIAETARLAKGLPADETQLLYSLCLHGRGELGLAPDEYAALTMVLLRLLPFKRPGAATLPVASAATALHTAPAGGAAEPLKKPESPAAAPALALPVQVTALGALWAECVQSLVAGEHVSGLVRELALQSELQSQDSGTWRLSVESPSLNQGDACQALLLALQSLPASPKFQTAERLQVEIGAATDTPARRQAAAMAQRQQEAEEIIDQDPLVQDMVRNWGARIVPGSVRMQAAAPVTAQAKPI
jgi:DNA polymerase-3 subunit gamma/tau